MSINKEELEELTAWLKDNGYDTVDDWMIDSDYLLVWMVDNDSHLVERSYWVDLDDNIVDPYEQAFHAMEASVS